MELIFIEPDGTRHSRQAQVGQTVMEVATASGVPGILGDCGGSCACATCHVHVSQDWRDRLQGPEAFELDMLEIVEDRSETSRLGCQIRLQEGMEGLTLHLSSTLL